MMAYDFQHPKTVQCGDVVTLRIPGTWYLSGNAEKGWCCDENDGEEAATLWISTLRSDWPIEQAGNSKSAVEQIVAHRTAEAPATLLESVLVENNGEFIWTYFFDSEDRGGAIRNFIYTFFMFDDDLLAAVVFNLVVDISRISEPEIRDLIEFVDREVRSAKITPFSVRRSDGIYADIHRMNFGDKVAVVLPEALDVSLGEDGEWYCSFHPDSLKARMTVRADDHLIRNGEGKSVKPDWTILDSMVRRLVGETFDDSRNIYFPDGVLIYEVFDSEADDDQSPPSDSVAWLWKTVRNHYWRYFRMEDWRVRQAQFRLTVPSDHDQELEDLIRFVEEEIKYAVFPDDSKERAGQPR